MFLENAFKPNNDFFKYLIGSVLIISASFVGQIPLGIGIFFKCLSDGIPFPTDQNELMLVLESNLTFFLIMISFVFAFFAIILVVRYLHKQTLLEITTSRKKIDWKRIFFSFSIWGIIVILSTIVGYYSSPEEYELNFKPIPFAILAVIAIILVPIQTSVEEYVFRGYLMQGFALLAKNRWFPLLMTSLIFGSLHIFNPEVAKMGYIILVYYIGTGLFLGVITLMDEGLELALGFHAANNLFTALLVTSEWTVFQTHSVLKSTAEPTAGLDVIIPVFVIFPILLIIFGKRYQWTNWKEKLTGKIHIEQENVT
ncbi:CPBP family intramembrane glutamic endopeptidase [Flavobacterium sp. '19STA2R22 D10 B1']|uniref:CPBP family intramembrane glutamic endopeptidase n=1 Tax=Flavobacterium aerium TaxID=3037261 RepID=UPI00278C8805|nr:CPBP family intramembrane glutamic endopeptidase [Flavobacterium sp. '19STA2R22 D10 B1']